MASTNSTEVRHQMWKAFNEKGGKEGGFGLVQVTLLGNPCQLDPCITSQEAEELGYGQTLFECLHNMHMPYGLLNEQYPMHPEIRSLVGKLTYCNSVQNSVKKDDRYLPLPTSYPTVISGFPIAWVNVTGQESSQDNSRSIQNIKEARAIVNLVATLIGLQKFKNENIVIITSYSSQVKLLHSTVLEACKAIKAGEYLENGYLSPTEMENELKKGQESDIVIYNIVRSNPYFSIQFLKNYKRLNIAISRAPCPLFILGNATMFPSLKEGQTFVSKELDNNPG
uniref:DNA2/NAM7 helicase-like C-terminal domain-containing protein n=1 Tax=Romanomermis culicivorax TaxID=13658 RepID=A0A915KWJ5_ROMCU